MSTMDRTSSPFTHATHSFFTQTAARNVWPLLTVSTLVLALAVGCGGGSSSNNNPVTP